MAEPIVTTPGRAAGPHAGEPASIPVTADPVAAGARAGADATHRVVRHYDFRRPDKFSKEQFRALRIVNDAFARILASSLTSQLRSSVQIHQTSIEEVTYGTYIEGVPLPTSLWVMTFDSALGQAVVALDLLVAQAMVDRLLGGSGIPSPRSRDLSEIELGLLKTIGGFFVTSLREAWAQVAPIQPSANEPVFSPEFVQITLPSEATAKLVFEVALFQTSGILSVCIPHAVLEPVMDRLTAHIWITGADLLASDDYTPTPMEQLKQANIWLSAELGTVRMSLRDVIAIAPGDILQLNSSVHNDLPIRIGRTAKFVGRAGTVGRNLAVRITRVLTEKE